MQAVASVRSPDFRGGHCGQGQRQGRETTWYAFQKDLPGYRAEMSWREAGVDLGAERGGGSHGRWWGPG